MSKSENPVAGQRWQTAMEAALAEAKLAATYHDVPIGAVVVDYRGEILGIGRNRRENDSDPTAHAEVIALRAAALNRRIRRPQSWRPLDSPPDEGWRLTGCTMVVTLEPCVMCAGAIVAARLDRLVFGAWDAKAGACGSVWDLVRDSANLHQVEVIPGVLAAQSAALLRDFFGKKR